MNAFSSRAICIEQHGGVEQMKLVNVTVGEPGAGEIRIRHHAVGLNFIDVYQRSGLYPLPMPLQLGMEAAGVVEAVGAGVTHLQVGDRAAYACQPPGSYCERRVLPAKCVCKLPDAISFETGAAMMLKGMTAQFLLKRTQPQGGLQAGDFVLFHAAAGGVGLGHQDQRGHHPHTERQGALRDAARAGNGGGRRSGGRLPAGGGAGEGGRV